MKRFYIILSSLFFFITINAQILDVPYRSDLNWICHVWCWAKSSHMAIVYYGNNIHLCDVLEYRRTKYYPAYGNDNCCNYPDSCCNGSSYKQVGYMLQHWAISNTYLDSTTLTLNEIQSDLQNNRPFIIHYPTHVVLGYGKYGDNIYIHDPGNGSVIRDYYDLCAGIGGGGWLHTHRITTSASTCLLVKNIPGLLNNTNSVYKATQLIEANCWITDSSNVEFLCEGEVILNGVFWISPGSTLTIETGVTLVCP